MMEIKLTLLLIISGCTLAQIGNSAHISLEESLQEYSITKGHHHSPRFKLSYLMTSITNDSSIISDKNVDDKSNTSNDISLNNIDDKTSSKNTNTNNNSYDDGKREHFKLDETDTNGSKGNSSNVVEVEDEEKTLVHDEEEYVMDSPRMADAAVYNVVLGEVCNKTHICSGDYVICKSGICRCKDNYVPITSNNNKPTNCEENYLSTVPLRGACNRTHRCAGYFTECREETCSCLKGYTVSASERDICRERVQIHMEGPKTDPTMIGVIVGLALMSVTLCVVMRLFARARFRENRTIFNTANPRLMNVSLKKVKKQITRGNSQAGGGGHRGSQDSVVITDSTRHSAMRQENDYNGQSFNLNRQENFILSTSIDEEPTGGGGKGATTKT